MSTLRTRFEKLPAAPMEASLTLAPGDREDYAALGEHHYRAGRPGTFTRVLTLRDHRPTVVGRFLARPAEDRAVAVLVESLPSLACRMRRWALGGRYAGIKDPKVRSRMLCDELRCISRVVVHPQWRGLGLAVRLVREALSTATTPLTEAIAAMGHVHPFFERAGMRAYPRPAHGFDQRLRDALGSVGIQPADLADVVGTLARLDALPAGQQAFIDRELSRWFARCRRSSRDAPTDRGALLAAARERLMCEPIYYLHDNR